MKKLEKLSALATIWSRKSRRQARKPRIVVDTNSLVAARWKKDGGSSRIMQMCIDGTIQALVSPAIEKENRHILGKVRPPAGYMEHLEKFYTSAETITDTPTLTVSEDPADDKFVECAVAGKAGYIISSDRHLLELDGYEGIRICKAGEFLKNIGTA